MRFQVPQFIEVEDKIFGPFTLRQFIYLAGGAGLCFIWYRFVPTIFVSALLIIPTAGFALALAFYQVNGRPFLETVEAFFNYAIGSRLYIWKKNENLPLKNPNTQNQDDASAYIPRLTNSKLKELTWHLDVKENMNPVTKDENESAPIGSLNQKYF